MTDIHNTLNEGSENTMRNDTGSEKTKAELIRGLDEKEIQSLRDAFDALFGKHTMNDEHKKTIDRYHLTRLILTDEEKIVDGEKKVKRLSQYRNDLAHVSLGIYTTLSPATIQIDIPEKSGSYKFIFVAPGILLGKQFTLMAGSEDFHRKIFERYKHSNTNESNKQFEKGLTTSDVNILGGGRIDLDVENKHIKFYGSSGSYACIADKIVHRATQSLRDLGRTTEIVMD